MEQRFDFLVKLAAVVTLVAGCFLVLKPFLTATLFAAVVCVTTWPLYLRLLHVMKGMNTIAALVMSVALTCLVILPLALVAYNLADNVTAIYNEIKSAIELGPIAAPEWLKNIPLIGNSAHDYWLLISTSQHDMDALIKRLLEPTKNFMLAGGFFLGQGVVEMSLVAFVSFFFYRDGLSLVRFLNVTMDRVVGAHPENILSIIKNTVQNVMYGILGTALAQGLVATIGFLIAGVPAAFLLGAATALLSLIPVGPPIVWGAAAIWLFYHGMTGWGIFILLWGFLLVSSVDNVLKPLLISRGSNLPFVLILFGVLGGIFAFGFVGVFIGPTLLAVGFSLLKEWSTPDSVI